MRPAGVYVGVYGCVRVLYVCMRVYGFVSSPSSVSPCRIPSPSPVTVAPYRLPVASPSHISHHRLRLPSPPGVSPWRLPLPQASKPGWADVTEHISYRLALLFEGAEAGEWQGATVAPHGAAALHLADRCEREM